MSLIYTPSYKREASAPTPEQPSQAPQAPPPRSRSLLEKVEGGIKSVGIDTWVGAAKSAADTALGFGELGQKIFNPWSWAGDEEAKKSQEFARDLRASKYVAPQTTGESVGFIGGKIAQAFIPGGLGMTGARAAAGLSSAPTAIRAAGAFATEALPAVLMAAGEEGSLTRDSLINGLLQGTTGVGGKIPNIAVGGVQMVRGAKQAMEGDVSGGALTAGFGALGVATGARTKGLLMNKAVFTPNVQKEMEKAARDFDNLIGPQKREAKLAQSKRLKGQAVKTPGQIAMEHRIFTTETPDGKLMSTLDTDANGRLITDNARLEVANRLETWESTLDNVLDDTYQRNSLSTLKDRVVQDIKMGKVAGIRSASDKKSAIADIESWFADEIEAAGDLVTDKKLNEIKRGLNSAYREGAPKLGYEAQRAARSILQKTVVDNTKDVDAQKINNIMGDLLDLDRYLKNAQERAIQGGKLTKSLRGLAGNIVGSQFGPLGSIVGGQIGEAAHDFAVDPYRRMIAAQEGLDLAKYTSPVEGFRGQVDEALQSRVKTNLTGEGKPKMLPAPSAIYAPAQTSSEGPRLMSQKEATEYLRSTGTLPSKEEIMSSMSGSPLKRMELLQRVQQHKE